MQYGELPPVVQQKRVLMSYIAIYSFICLFECLGVNAALKGGVKSLVVSYKLQWLLLLNLFWQKARFHHWSCNQKTAVMPSQIYCANAFEYANRDGKEIRKQIRKQKQSTICSILCLIWWWNDLICKVHRSVRAMAVYCFWRYFGRYSSKRNALFRNDTSDELCCYFLSFISFIGFVQSYSFSNFDLDLDLKSRVLFLTRVIKLGR